MVYKRIVAQILLLLLLSGVTALAGKLETVLVAPAEIPQTGGPVVFSIFFHNWNDETVQTNLPEKVICQLEADGRIIEVAARATDSNNTGKTKIRGKGFIKAAYTFNMPASVRGPVRMKIPVFGKSSVMFAVRTKDKASPEKDTAEADDKKHVDQFIL
jgi:hypothetical protein